ncbi:3-deoxy-D-manno-octulosonic acid transferase [Brumimicrobium aurantiacum]|uniref:3-deoxy-D-manno-octulosonic acid transferase n=1 Tax=Brumimicrobium aurantiacum TaxID=1737063 RepID=A0A3E1EVP9_9FLAO|nr:glycosyltransferase N-terminal domain-containing protein [Brumimicrobium aurantiacum]RFC53635.1 3-deoxy-D-manno-octulosonic acid transferase [Brumimicrobium aurantiacum]
MLYNLGIFLYGFILKVVSNFHPKAKKWVEGRKDFWNQLPSTRHKNVVWFHCASLGEYDQGLPIMEAWKKNFPNDYILVTFFSPSGYENIKHKSIGDYTCYIPLDTKQNARKFIAHFKPQKVFFIKYEIWINHLKAAKNSGAELYSISASFRKNQRFFKWYGAKFRNALSLFNHLFVQYENSKVLLKDIGITNVTVSGDTRYDRVHQRASKNKENPTIATWSKDETVFVIGSSWSADEEMIIPLINKGDISEKVIIAPHEVNNSHIEQIEQQLKVSYQKYTDLQKGIVLDSKTKVLLLDCIGVLADAYRYGNIAYVGGGFGTGLHNILEPASFGLPVIFGPIHEKFPEAKEFIEAGIGASCKDRSDFFHAYSTFQQKSNIQDDVISFIDEKKGATDIVMSHLTY